MRVLKKTLCFLLAVSFTVFWLYVLDWVILYPLQRYSVKLPPSYLRLTLDVIGAILGFCILLGSIPATVKNYRHIERILLGDNKVIVKAVEAVRRSAGQPG